MLAGSTLGLSLRRRNPALLVKSLSIPTPHRPHRALGERNRPGDYRPPTTDIREALRAHSLSRRSVADGSLCLARPPVFSGVPVLLPGKNAVNQVTGLLPVTQDDGHVLRIQKPQKTRVHTRRKCPAQRRRTLLWIMLTTKSPVRAWAAYQELLSHQVMIPHHLLHQLVRLLASVKPRTRTVYLQLLSALKMLQKNGGRLRLWEWNTLIDCTGKQWHKTRSEDYENSLDIFNKKGALPAGSTASADESFAAESYLTQQDPDIRTYNILLSIASRSTLPLAVRHASSLLLTSGLPPNRLTHLCLLRYFTVQKDLRSVRSTLRKMKQQGLEVGLDGINACLWAYAQNGRFDVALCIYRLLRSNANRTGEHDVGNDSRYIYDVVGLDNLAGFEPDEITYTMMIQALAYHGDLRNALGVFVDMLSTPKRESGSHSDDNTVCYKPSLAAFRGLFLGFSRHGRIPENHKVEAEPVATLFPASQATWHLDTLEAIFAAFLRLPDSPKPTGRLVYWILVAFEKTSGKDPAKLREVWTKLEAKYGGNWGGRLEEIRRSIFTPGDGSV